VMERRCVVETWAEFGLSGTSCSPRVAFDCGTDVFLCTGSDEVYLFNTQERKLTAVLQFPGPVSDLAESHDKQFLYVCCSTGVYCVSVPLLLSSSRVNASSSPTELKISSEFLVVGEEGALSLLLVGSLLLIVSQRDTSWLLSLYKTPKQTQSSSYEMLSSFSVPLVSAVAHGEELNIQLRRRPVLICVYSGHATTTSLSCTFPKEATLTNHFHLEPVLFKLLFGIDAALTKSPVVLCGLPDGRLCFLPLLLPGSRFQVLHSLEQPVVLVGASVVMEMGSGHAQCLLAVGEQGRVLLIKTDKGGPEGDCSTAGFTEVCVPGPVVCGYVDKHHLYYSTGSDLLLLDLSDGSHGKEGQERNEETSSKSGVALQNPTSLNVCRVIGLAKPTQSAAGEVQLLGLSVRGQLQRITLPAGRDDSRLSELPSTQMGRGVKDLLSAIGDVCERASMLKVSIKSKNQILRHLNQVLNISFLLTASKKNEEHFPIQKKPIKCHAITRWSRLLQKDSLHLMCVLDNSSPYILEQGWTLSITVCPLSCSPSVGGESSSTNFSFPFENLHPGETLEVCLPLAAAGDTSFPMTVNCSLIFSLTALLEEKELVSFTGLKSRSIILPLNTLTVDWLHVLQVNSPTASHKSATFQSNNVTAGTVRAFLSSNQHRCIGRGAGGVRVSKHKEEQYSASLHVTPELLRDTLVLKSSGLDPQGLKLDPPNLSICLLNWLLSEYKTALSSLFGLQVRIDSTSIAAVCGLHHAVLHRMHPSAFWSSLDLKTILVFFLFLSFFLLLSFQRLLQQIQQSQISEAFGVGVSAGQMSPALLSVYRELRENPLVII
uniref:FA core complex associated protein 100 n=1 Tax=Anabas testudineus TaxID=64144 RepID=A0A3Q1ID42_ANATE